MTFNEDLAVKNGAEKMKISDDRSAWVLPEKESFRKMIAYAQKERWIWIHPQYKNGQDDKKKKQKRQETSKA
tara:strand:- start:44330 stop:44545 length:216 start_codon:yes stop_codon:yes gene_type:complete